MEICSVGGYNEVGKNMTAIRVGDEAVICDMGLFLPAIIDFEEEGGHRAKLTSDSLIRLGAIPDDRVLKDWKPYVKAIVIGHCHLDHCGAVAYLANKYNCPIIGTPFTLEVLKSMLRDDNLELKNEFRSMNAGSKMRISKTLEIEFVNATHSTPQTVMIALHTAEGIVIYANDFKFDNNPVLGKAPDYEKLRSYQGNVKALIVESLYAHERRKTPSESVAREMLKDVLLGTENRGHAIIVTAFASHIARMKSVIEFGRKLDRKVVLLGRSMRKYVLAAEKANIVNFSKEVEIYGYAQQIEKQLKKIEKRRNEYLIICTGGQGEPKSVLSKMATEVFPFQFLPEDHIIFSCRTIPVDINIANRALLERKLRMKKVRIFTDIHVSGHAAREDLHDFLDIVKAKHLIPAHGDAHILNALGDLGMEMGYEHGKNLHIMRNGQILKIN